MCVVETIYVKAVQVMRQPVSGVCRGVKKGPKSRKGVIWAVPMLRKGDKKFKQMLRKTNFKLQF
jgi:hypothetical protein